jgi:hypothetical protein
VLLHCSQTTPFPSLIDGMGGTGACECGRRVMEILVHGPEVHKAEARHAHEMSSQDGGEARVGGSPMGNSSNRLVGVACAGLVAQPGRRCIEMRVVLIEGWALFSALCGLVAQPKGPLIPERPVPPLSCSKQ